MRRRIAGIATGLVLVAITAVLGAPVAGAACPNEAFRTGPSAALAECRAYEQVTPVDKESAVAVTEFEAAYASPVADGVFFSSTGTYAGQEGSFVDNPYVSLRGADTWSTRGVGGLQTVPGFALSSIGAVSPDLRYSAITSGEVLAPGALEGTTNVYVRDNLTGSYTLVRATGEGNGSGGGAPFGAGTADWSTTLFSVSGGVYELRGGQSRLLVPEAYVAGGSENVPNAISADGSKFFYFHQGLLYLYRPGLPPLLVSEDEAGTPLAGGNLLGATPDAEVAFFSDIFGGRLFRFEAAAPEGERVTQISPLGRFGEQPVVRQVRVSEAGDYVYFAAKGLLTPEAEPRPENPQPGAENGYALYVWHEGAGVGSDLRYIGESDEPYEGSPPQLSVSPNGRFFGFGSVGEVTPDAIDGSAESCPVQNTVGRCENVFLYSYDADSLACASCDGVPPAGFSRLGGSDRDAVYNAVHPVLDDGMVLFDSPNALVGRDTNGVRDVYAWQDGRTQLISGGTDAGPSFFTAVSPTGRDIYFGTEQGLVGQDEDSIGDLYDARVGGGLPQGAKLVPPPCQSESGCRGGTASGKLDAPAASGSIGENGNVDGACLARRGKARAAKKRSRVLTGRAGRATGKRAKALRKSAAREAKAARRLGRRAGNCTGGGR